MDAWIIEPVTFYDHRGSFMESWSIKDMEEHGLHYSFVQENQSLSKKKGTLRGLHFQRDMYAQAKLARCISGAVMDVAVDIRYGSPTYRQWIAVELSAENKRQLLIPRGFAHGFVTLTDNVIFLYKVDNYYKASHEASILWNDAILGVQWGIAEPIISVQDAAAPVFNDEIEPYFIYNSGRV